MKLEVTEAKKEKKLGYPSSFEHGKISNNPISRMIGGLRTPQGKRKNLL